MSTGEKGGPSLGLRAKPPEEEDGIQPLGLWPVLGLRGLCFLTSLPGSREILGAL